jgi:hypothetical protein
MELRVHGPAPTGPFLGAQDRFETEHDLDRPVHVHVRADPDERTWTAHHDDHHVLNISRKAANSAMARELALHEYAHMARHEEAHPSHVQSTEEALFLALAGTEVQRHRLTHCYQIANHAKDIYADDITVAVGPTDKLVAYLESRLATALRDAQRDPPREGSRPTTGATDPDITAVNAAFAVALCERHDLLDDDHRLYDLAHAADDDAPDVDLDRFRRQFRSLARDPSESDYRKALVDLTREYATAGDGTRAAD